MCGSHLNFLIIYVFCVVYATFYARQRVKMPAFRIFYPGFYFLSIWHLMFHLLYRSNVCARVSRVKTVSGFMRRACHTSYDFKRSQQCARDSRSARRLAMRHWRRRWHIAFSPQLTQHNTHDIICARLFGDDKSASGARPQDGLRCFGEFLCATNSPSPPCGDVYKTHTYVHTQARIIF